jgi:hypothetical protein
MAYPLSTIVLTIVDLLFFCSVWDYIQDYLSVSYCVCIFAQATIIICSFWSTTLARLSTNKHTTLFPSMPFFSRESCHWPYMYPLVVLLFVFGLEGREGGVYVPQLVVDGDMDWILVITKTQITYYFWYGYIFPLVLPITTWEIHSWDAPRTKMRRPHISVITSRIID